MARGDISIMKRKQDQNAGVYAPQLKWSSPQSWTLYTDAENCHFPILRLSIEISFLLMWFLSFYIVWNLCFFSNKNTKSNLNTSGLVYFIYLVWGVTRNFPNGINCPLSSFFFFKIIISAHLLPGGSLLKSLWTKLWTQCQNQIIVLWSDTSQNNCDKSVRTKIFFKFYQCILSLLYCSY